MRCQFIDELNILDLQVLFDLLAQPLVQLLNYVILPLLRLHTGRYHAFGGERNDLLEVEDDQVWDVLYL